METNLATEKITVHNVKKFYGENAVLDVESLSIAKGAIVAIIGKNGSGKSTLLKMISGLLYQSEGDIEVFGIKNQSSKIKECCKFVLESGQGYYAYLSARENIEYFLGLNKLSLSKVQSHFEKLVRDFDFKEHLDKKVSELSQGTRQKLAIIIALLTNPEVLCLDEPTNGLDITSSNQLLSSLKQIAMQEQKTVLFTTHDLGFIQSIDARAVVLKEGKLVYDGKINEFSKSLNEKYVFRMASEKSDLLKRLQSRNFRTEFQGEFAIVHCYDEQCRDEIVANVEFDNLSKESLDVDDLFYKVIQGD
ncbi:MAG: ABC transporter ATP-binding protein [Peptostreptococcaceae bacterium]|nr:ABC transporter ATP-binding protein [Peptostreptococcaceae bacterium]